MTEHCNPTYPSIFQSPDNHYSSADNLNTSNGVSSGSYTISQPSVSMSQAMMHGLTGSQEFQQPHPYYMQADVGGSGPSRGMNQASLQQSPHHLSHHNKIPDIVFNGEYLGGGWIWSVILCIMIKIPQKCLFCIGLDTSTG